MDKWSQIGHKNMIDYSLDSLRFSVTLWFHKASGAVLSKFARLSAFIPPVQMS